MVLLYVIAYAYAINFAIFASKKRALTPVNNMHKGCVVECADSLKVLTLTRGDNYYIGESDANQAASPCLVTFWGFTHFFLYSLLGYFCPDLFIQTFIIGCVFELYEKEKYQCQDAFDIALNTAGFIVGRGILKYQECNCAPVSSLA